MSKMPMINILRTELDFHHGKRSFSCYWCQKHEPVWIRLVMLWLQWCTSYRQKFSKEQIFNSVSFLPNREKKSRRICFNGATMRTNSLNCQNGKRGTWSGITMNILWLSTTNLRVLLLSRLQSLIMYGFCSRL